MLRLFKAFLFRLFRDLTFKITLFIGLGMALLTTIGYLMISKMSDTQLISGEGMIIQSLSPAQNFGIALPVNLVSFTVIEFLHGTIRNKIIAGNSKAKIYASLFLSGLIFTIIVMVCYISLCFLLGTILGGFHPNDGINPVTSIGFDYHYLLRMLLICFFTYLSITSFAIMFATIFRQIGGTIPVVIIGLMACYFVAYVPSFLGMLGGNDELSTLLKVLRIVDPLYAISSQELKLSSSNEPRLIMSNETLIAGIINNTVYAALFFIAGMMIFKKRDVK